MRVWVVAVGLIVMLGCKKGGEEPVIPDELFDCGCGCCGGVPPEDAVVCLSREEMAARAALQAKAGPVDPEKCANVGCSRGTRYRVCSR